MLLCVIYYNGKTDFVKGSALATLIESREIIRFKRYDGWVDIDSPRVRKADTGGVYWGRERRNNSTKDQEK